MILFFYFSCCQQGSSVIRTLDEHVQHNFSAFNDSYIFCADDSNELLMDKNRFCSSGNWKHFEISENEYSIENERGVAVISKKGDVPNRINVDSSYYCVGYFCFKWCKGYSSTVDLVFSIK